MYYFSKEKNILNLHPEELSQPKKELESIRSLRRRGQRDTFKRTNLLEFIRKLTGEMPLFLPDIPML